MATGAADGYARATGAPAAALLHLGPGLANGWANLHNARRARSPLVAVVGDHATFHAGLDAPLQSDLLALAGALEGWSRRCERADDVARDAADAVGAALGPPGRVATLALRADAAWDELSAAPGAWPVAARVAPSGVGDAALGAAVRALRSGSAAILVGGAALDAASLGLAARAAAAADAGLLLETFPATMDHGAGVADAERIIYLSEFALAQLAPRRALVLVGARHPVGFFGYPGVASDLVAEGCEVVDLAPPGADARAALAALADALGAPAVAVPAGEPPGVPDGPLTSASMAAAVGATLPEGVVVVDESNTAGVHLLGATRFSPPHRWLSLTGGSIGDGLPLALGAAVGSGGRVLCLEADGSMMYTPQALWSMAREGLDVTVVALANRRYSILELERRRVGAPVGSATESLLRLDGPELDLAGVARSLGVPASRVDTAEALADALARSYATPGPTFVEAVLPPGL